MRNTIQEMKKSNRFRFKIRYVLLFGLVALAVFTRFFRFDERMRFIWDEGRDMLAIRAMIVNRDVTLFGPFNEIDGKKDFFGVFHYYLMAPALWLFHFDPRGPALFTMLLNLLAIGLAVRLFSQWQSQKFIWVLWLWFCVSPLLVRHSLWPWNPNTTPFFGVVYLWLLNRLRQQSAIRLSLLSGLCLGLLFQLHYFSIVLGLSWVLMVLAEIKKERGKHWLAFVGGFIGPNLSFVLFDITHEGFYRNILVERFLGSTEQRLFSVSLIRLLSKPFIYGSELARSLTGLPFLLSAAVFIAILYEAIASIKLFWHTRAVTPRALIGLPFLGLLGIATFSNGLIDDYHSLPLAIGILWMLWEWLRKVVPLKGAVVAGVFMALVMFFNLELFSPAGWDQGITPLEKTGKIIAEDADSEIPFTVAAFTDTDTRAVRYRYFVVKAGAEPLGVTEYPLAKVVYVVTGKDDLSDEDRRVWELASFQNVLPERVGQVGELRIFKLIK